MATSKRKRSSLKRIRQNIRRRQRNRAATSALRTLVKRARAASPAERAEQLREAQRALDKAAEHGLIHKNQAARRKARLMKALAKQG